MVKGKYDIFMHYQYRIMLGYKTPALPAPSEMTSSQWNHFVDGFDVDGFTQQMEEAQVGWVMFCLDDHYLAWPSSPNSQFDLYTGYEPGEKCSRRDMIMKEPKVLQD